MVRGNSHESTLDPTDGMRRESARELLRRPWVQGLLALAAAGQFAAGTAGGETVTAQGESATDAVVAQLAPVVVRPDGGEVKRRSATQLVSEMIARYRKQGYTLTPKLARIIHEAAEENDIDPEVAFGLIRAESSFRNVATSPVGAVGLTQLMPATARWLEPGVTRAELRDPETNVRIGFKYLRNLIDKYEGNEDLALLAYNRGPGTVDRALKRGRNPDNGYAAFVRGKSNHGHKLFTR